MIVMERERPTMTTPSLSQTQLKYLANGVLKALRRGPSRHTEGTEDRLQFIGVSSIPNGPPPHTLHARWMGISEPHEGLNLPCIALYFTPWLKDLTQDLCYQHEWAHLERAARDTNVKRLYRIKQDNRGNWYAERNPDAYNAATAARTLVNLARIYNDPNDWDRYFFRVCADEWQ